MARYVVLSRVVGQMTDKTIDRTIEAADAEHAIARFREDSGRDDEIVVAVYSDEMTVL